ncbi:MAG: hypothetical protein WBB01_03265 [Phormidesmis sp.]
MASSPLAAPPPTPQALENTSAQRSPRAGRISPLLPEIMPSPASADSANTRWRAEAARHLPEATVIEKVDLSREIPDIVQGRPDDSEAETARAAAEGALPDGDSQLPEIPRVLVTPAQPEGTQVAEAATSNSSLLNEDLGTLQVLPLRSRENEELGVLQLLQTAQARAPKQASPIAFLTGRAGYFSSENVFRSDPSLSEQIYQTGLSFYLSPRLSERTSLYVIAETNIARYENLRRVSYNDLGVQAGLRQRLSPRTYAQIGWRNQQLYSPGYRNKLFDVNAIDTLISYRSILNSKMWLDSFYQTRLEFAAPSAASRFRQTLTLSLNYGVTRNLRSSLIYQLDFDKYTQIPRFDTYHQILGVISYNINDTSRISLFGGTRFGRSSVAEVSLEDTFYGAGLNVSLPLF